MKHQEIGLDHFKLVQTWVFWTCGFYDIFLDETTNNIEARYIMTMSKCSRKIDEVMVAMDLIVFVFGLAPVL